MKNFVLVLLGSLVMLVTMSNSSCKEKVPTVTSADVEQAQGEELLNEAMKQVGMPNIDKFTERKLMKMILELKDDENLICHAYLANEMEGTLGTYLGRCLGYGVPAATQFSNPEKVVKKHGDGGQYDQDFYFSMPQPEPNGLNMPTSTSATWVILLDKEGKPRVCYIEQTLNVFPFPIHLNLPPQS